MIKSNATSTAAQFCSDNETTTRSWVFTFYAYVNWRLHAARALSCQSADFKAKGWLKLVDSQGKKMALTCSVGMYPT